MHIHNFVTYFAKLYEIVGSRASKVRPRHTAIGQTYIFGLASLTVE